MINRTRSVGTDAPLELDRRFAREDRDRPDPDPAPTAHARQDLVRADPGLQTPSGIGREDRQLPAAADRAHFGRNAQASTPSPAPPPAAPPGRARKASP